MLLPAKAQMTPEAVMGMTPDLPTTAALLNHWEIRICQYDNLPDKMHWCPRFVTAASTVKRRRSWPEREK